MSEPEKVRIAVAIDRNRKYAAIAESAATDPWEWIIGDLEPGELRYIVTAELALPESAEVVEVEGTPEEAGR